jgi:ribose 5-phosphate isomerase B
MNFYIGSDHRGFKLKELVKQALMAEGYAVTDVGNETYDENDDYPLVAKAVAEKVSFDYEQSRGVLLCGSGVGVAIVANKYVNVRAGLVTTPDQAFDAKNDDDVNILCLPADYLEWSIVEKILKTWLETPFSGEERFKRRLKEISAIEASIVKKIEDDAVEDALKQREARFDM